MAGAKVPAPLDPMVNGDDWTNILARLERTYKGYDGVSLTEWAAGNTTRPEIAAGSVIEIDGSPFYYATDETIVDGGGLIDGWCYIKHVVSGSNVTPTLVNTFGTWDTAKQGFYDGNDRFSLFAMYRSGAITKIFTEKDEIDYKTAKLGYRYYEKQYAGTVGGGPSYLISFTDSFFNASSVVNIFLYYNITGSIGYVNKSLTTYGITTIDIAVATTAAASGKPYGANIKYKLTL